MISVLLVIDLNVAPTLDYTKFDNQDDMQETILTNETSWLQRNQ